MEEKNDKIKIIEKVGKVYQIYSPSLDKYYIGSTYSSLALRKAIHKYHYKLYEGGKFNKLTSYELLKQNDCVYSILKQYEDISKRDLLDEETKQIMFLKQKLGDKIVNKNNSGLTLNMKEYYKNKAKKYYEKNKEERSVYFKQRYLKIKDKLKEQRDLKNIGKEMKKRGRPRKVEPKNEIIN